MSTGISKSNCKNCGEDNHDTAKCKFSRKLRCYTCGKTGHKSKSCRSKRKLQSSNRPSHKSYQYGHIPQHILRGNMVQDTVPLPPRDPKPNISCVKQFPPLITLTDHSHGNPNAQCNVTNHSNFAQQYRYGYPPGNLQYPHDAYQVWNMPAQNFQYGHENIGFNHVNVYHQ